MLADCRETFAFWQLDLLLGLTGYRGSQHSARIFLHPNHSTCRKRDNTDNVMRLGTETLFAIGEELRRMYDADLHSKPSERLERLIRLIERGEKLP